MNLFLAVKLIFSAGLRIGGFVWDAGLSVSEGNFFFGSRVGRSLGEEKMKKVKVLSAEISYIPNFLKDLKKKK